MKPWRRYKYIGGGLVYLSLSGQILAYLGIFGIKIVVAF